MTIPKIIHYVWVGPNEKSETIKRCISTWKKNLPDYEIKEWNEKNFDISQSPYCMQAYESKKYAFVSDFIRAKVIHDQGGIYFDTDILVLKSLDDFLNNRAFVGFENPQYPFTAVFGAEPGHPFVKKILEYYEDLDFHFDSKNQFDTVNTKTVSDILINDYNCAINNSFQILDDDIAVYPDGILCNPSDKSFTVHIFTGTWLEGKSGIKKNIVEFLRSRLTNHSRIKVYNFILGKIK